jgi:hypothetical protein
MRHQQGLPFEIFSPLSASDRPAMGLLAQQRVWVVGEHGDKPIGRRLRRTLAQATRDGAMLGYILTNCPRQVAAKRGAQRDRKRWTLETACQPGEAYVHAASNPLG